MNIYIDEAGVFAPPLRSGKHLYSLVLALIIPTSSEPQLFYEFLRLRDTWPHRGIEIKGSKLDENQTAQVTKLLAEHRVVAEYQAIDMGLHQCEEICDFKSRQAAELTANLAPEHDTRIVQRQQHDAEAIRTMSNQLFVQAFVTIELVLEVLDTAINYFAQREPSEIGRFVWMIDQKDRTITQMEQTWTSLILPVGVTRSAKRPYVKVEGFDYSHFAKYEIEESTADEKERQHFEWMRRTLPFSSTPPTKMRCLNANRILTEERTFADSKDNLGLQLADIVASTLCRALNKRLQLPGWKPLSQLLIRKKIAPFLQIGKAGHRDHGLEAHAATVWRTLDAGSNAMVV